MRAIVPVLSELLSVSVKVGASVLLVPFTILNTVAVASAAVEGFLRPIVKPAKSKVIVLLMVKVSVRSMFVNSVIVLPSAAASIASLNLS